MILFGFEAINQSSRGVFNTHSCLGNCFLSSPGLAVLGETHWSSSHLTDLFLVRLPLLERVDPSVMTPR